MVRRVYLPCNVTKRGQNGQIVLEQSSPLIPVEGCRLLRFDGVKGVVTALYGGTVLQVLWQTPKGATLATYTSVRFGPVI